MKNLKVILSVLIVLVIIGVVFYVLNSEGIVTLDKLDNLLQNGLEKIKDWWNSATADPVV